MLNRIMLVVREAEYYARYTLAAGGDEFRPSPNIASSPEISYICEIMVINNGRERPGLAIIFQEGVGLFLCSGMLPMRGEGRLRQSPYKE